MEHTSPHPSDNDLVTRVIAWFDGNARALPWREDPSAWGVLVSEVMLQQTPVNRVLPVWQAWMARWPTPNLLAAEPLAEALRAWGRLGYPRRAMRLHESARVITAEYAGVVPHSYNELLALPGVGDYTAAAVASFAYGATAVVLDVNVRRLLVRHQWGIASPPPGVTRAERALGQSLLPSEGAATWAAASMELGQVVCTARNPNCTMCPLSNDCAWLAAGKPGEQERTTRPQSYAGTDRQVRGIILAKLHDGAARIEDLHALWHDDTQLARALDSLVVDGLVDPVSDAVFALPEEG